MKEEHKKKWVTALRSGEYRQARSVLFGREGYCCLGVALEAALGSGWELDEGEYIPTGTLRSDDEKDHELTPHELRLLGVEQVQQEELIRMNDKEGKTFDEIADWIEANL